MITCAAILADTAEGRAPKNRILAVVQIKRVRDALLIVTFAVYTAGMAAVGLALISIVALGEVVRRTWRWIPTSLDRPLAGFALAAIISSVFSEWRGFSLANSLLLVLMMIVSVRTVAAYAAGDTGRCLRVLMWWAVGGVAAALWVAAHIDPTGRINGSLPTLVFSNHVGTTLAIATVLTMALVPGRPRAQQSLLVVGLIILLAGLVGTWSRGAWLGASAGMLTLLAVGVRPRGRTGLAAILVAAALAAVVLTRWPELRAEIVSVGSLQANRNRILLWATALRMIPDYPLVGTGFATFDFAYQRYRSPDSFDITPSFAHNLLLNTAVEMGALGLVAIIALCATGLGAARRWARRSPQGSSDRLAANAVLAALVALLANQMVDGTIQTVHVGFGFFALLALAAHGGRDSPGHRPDVGGARERSGEGPLDPP